MVETRDSGGRSLHREASEIPSQITVRLASLLLLSVTVEQLYKPATNVLTCNQALAGLLYLMLQVRLVLPVAFSYYFPSISKRRPHHGRRQAQSAWAPTRGRPSPLPTPWK